MNKIKVLFILPNLTAGGAQRVLSFLSNSLSTVHFESILLIIGYEKDSVYNYSHERTYFLNKKRTLSGVSSVIKFIWREKPDVVIGSIGQINVLLGLLSIYFKKTRFIGRVTSVRTVNNQYSKANSNILLDKIYRFSDKKLSRIICQSEDMSNDLEKKFNIPKHSIRIINNPITTVPITIKIHNPIPNTIKLIMLGRLSQVEGHTRL